MILAAWARDAAAVATLITAIAGFIAVILRQRTTDTKVTKVYDSVNSVDEPPKPGEPMTLGQSVRRMSDDIETIKRELGIQEKER